MKKLFIQISLITGTICFIQSAMAGIIISSTHDASTETAIYQKGIAIYLVDGKAKSIIDTNTNNCIAINHKSKHYLLVKCKQFKIIVKSLEAKKQKNLNRKVSYAVQEMMASNQPPITDITIKRSGRGTYQGFHVEKFQFIVDDEVVSEYWMSSNLKEKIDKEIDMDKLNHIIHYSEKNKKFSKGLSAKINVKFTNFSKHKFPLKEFRYTGSETKKIYRHVTMKRVKIRKYLPPKSYKISSTLSDFLNDGT